jgi:hypothetical protein
MKNHELREEPPLTGRPEPTCACGPEQTPKPETAPVPRLRDGIYLYILHRVRSRRSPSRHRSPQRAIRARLATSRWVLPPADCVRAQRELVPG